MKIFIAFAVLSFFLSCTKKNTVDPPNNIGDDFGEKISFEDDSRDSSAFYYLDSLKIDSLLYWSKSEIELVNNDLFSVNDGKLFLKNPYILNRANFLLKFRNKDSQEEKEFKVKIRGWKCGEYSLKTYQKISKTKFFVYTKNNVTYYFKDDKLYRKIGKSGSLEYLCDFLLEDYMYNQMVADDNYFAVRTGKKLFVSKDLKNWKLIFTESRGIKQSMVIINNSNGKELLFSEYNPGDIYIRQSIRAYNFSTQETVIRKLFYSRNEYYKNNLLPTTRHIHFLLADPYSNLIFMGNGDLNHESAIYFSDDNGLNFKLLGGGEQIWRSLSMFFTPNSIFWTSDTQTSQYILRLDRNKIIESANIENVKKFPLINGALWCSEQISTTEFIQSSNNEGGLYDNKYRNFYIKIINDIPQCYEVFSKIANGPYDQKYPVGIDLEGYVYLLDLNSYQIDKTKIVKNK
jgi:hypothetical protein